MCKYMKISLLESSLVLIIGDLSEGFDNIFKYIGLFCTIMVKCARSSAHSIGLDLDKEMAMGNI